MVLVQKVYIVMYAKRNEPQRTPLLNRVVKRVSVKS